MTTGELRRVLGSVVEILERSGIRYHVTGGLASSFYGEPRLTQDVDFVVRLDRDSARALVKELEGEFLIDEDRVLRATDRASMFQALHRELLIKADFHVGEDVPGELDRGQTEELFEGLEVRLVSKADAILYKLLWLKDGSQKSRDDVAGILLDPGPMDAQLLESLSDELGCADLLQEIRDALA